jgi:hypothetical protein
MVSLAAIPSYRFRSASLIEAAKEKFRTVRDEIETKIKDWVSHER